MKQKGFVTLIGAGPYDKGLITVKGLEKIREADCILYDRLINPAFLFEAPENCQLIDVGKEQANHKLRQNEINDLILEKALEGKKVVRLKGGDPFLFGRGAEELELPLKHGIPFEVVPGITSAIAVPAYGGIPVTHRDFSSSLHIITGHYREGKAFDIDFDSLVRLGGTLVFLMGLENLPAITQGLIKAGLSAEFPAALIENGTSSKQRTFTGALGELQNISRENRVKSPAVILVGEVAGLSDKFDWFSNKPLSKMRLLIACHENSTKKLANLLYKLGCDSLPYPCAQVEPVHFLPFQFSRYNWLIFTSRQGVKFFFREFLHKKIDFRTLYGLRIAVVGKETEKELNGFGFTADYAPKIFQSKALGEGLPFQKGDRLLLAQAAEPDGLLREVLTERGADFTELPVYKTRLLKNGPVDLKEIDGVVFTSASNVKGFALSVGAENLQGVRALCIGPQTALAASGYGMETHTAGESTFNGIAELCCELLPFFNKEINGVD